MLSVAAESCSSYAVDSLSVDFNSHRTRNSLTVGSTKFEGVAGANVNAIVDQEPDVTERVWKAHGAP